MTPDRVRALRPLEEPRSHSVGSLLGLERKSEGQTLDSGLASVNASEPGFRHRARSEPRSPRGIGPLGNHALGLVLS